MNSSIINTGRCLISLISHLYTFVLGNVVFLIGCISLHSLGLILNIMVMLKSSFSIVLIAVILIVLLMSISPEISTFSFMKIINLNDFE